MKELLKENYDDVTEVEVVDSEDDVWWNFSRLCKYKKRFVNIDRILSIETLIYLFLCNFKLKKSLDLIVEKL